MRDASPGQTGKEENESGNNTLHRSMIHFAISPPPTPPTRDPGRHPAGDSAIMFTGHMGLLQKDFREELYAREVHGRWHGWGDGGVYLPSPLSSPISHWLRLTPEGANTHSFLGHIAQPFRSPPHARSQTYRAVFHPSPKMKGQSGEGGHQPRPRKQHMWKSEKPQEVYAAVQLD